MIRLCRISSFLMGEHFLNWFDIFVFIVTLRLRFTFTCARFGREQASRPPVLTEVSLGGKRRAGFRGLRCGTAVLACHAMKADSECCQVVPCVPFARYLRESSSTVSSLFFKLISGRGTYWLLSNSCLSPLTRLSIHLNACLASATVWETECVDAERDNPFD